MSAVGYRYNPEPAEAPDDLGYADTLDRLSRLPAFVAEAVADMDHAELARDYIAGQPVSVLIDRAVAEKVADEVEAAEGMRMSRFELVRDWEEYDTNTRLADKRRAA